MQQRRAATRAEALFFSHLQRHRSLTLRLQLLRESDVPSVRLLQLRRRLERGLLQAAAPRALRLQLLPQLAQLRLGGGLGGSRLLGRLAQTRKLAALGVQRVRGLTGRLLGAPLPRLGVLQDALRCWRGGR